MPLENLAARIKEGVFVPPGAEDVMSSSPVVEEIKLPPKEESIQIREETPQAEQQPELISDDELWIQRLMDRLKQGGYPNSPLFIDGKYIIHDFKKCAQTHIRYYREATGVIELKNEHEVASKKKTLDGIKRLVELAEECENGICVFRSLMPVQPEKLKEKKFDEAEVESWILRLENALEEGNFPTKTMPVPGKPYITIVNFEKCVRRQISTHRAWSENKDSNYDYAQIVADRLRDLVGIIDGMPERVPEVEQAETPTVEQKSEFSVLF